MERVGDDGLGVAEVGEQLERIAVDESIAAFLHTAEAEDRCAETRGVAPQDLVLLVVEASGVAVDDDVLPVEQPVRGDPCLQVREVVGEHGIDVDRRPLPDQLFHDLRRVPVPHRDGVQPGEVLGQLTP